MTDKDGSDVEGNVIDDVLMMTVIITVIVVTMGDYINNSNYPINDNDNKKITTTTITPAITTGSNSPTIINIINIVIIIILINMINIIIIISQAYRTNGQTEPKQVYKRMIIKL